MNQILDLEVFRNKRVLVTGHTGFKGAWLSYLLYNVGAEVTGIALEPQTNPNLYSMLDLEAKITSHFADIRNFEDVDRVFQECKPEIVFHLAAQAIVTESYINPVETFQTNVLGSANILEAVRHNSSVRCLVYITSDKCYVNKEWEWGYREHDELGGRDPYSASKAAAELLFTAYSKSYFDDTPSLGVASARAGNVIGGGDWSKDRIIPDSYRSAENGGSLDLRNPAATRPWQHVLEPISGYLLLAAKLLEEPKRYSGAWNFGPDTSAALTVSQVASRFFEKLGRGGLSGEVSPSKLHEAHLLQLNCDKAKLKLGWKPTWNQETSIDQTANWYREYNEGTDMQSFTKVQIEKYFEGTK